MVKESDIQPESSSLISKMLSGIALGFLVFGLFFLWGDVQSVSNIITAIPWYCFVLAIIATLCNFLIRFYKWRYFLLHLNIKMPIKEMLPIFLVGLSMSITPGKLGELVKSYLLKRVGNVSISCSASSVFADRLTDLLAVLLLMGIGLFLFSFGQLAFIFMVMLLLVGMLFLKWRSASFWVINLFTSNRLLNKYRQNIVLIYESIYLLLRFRLLLWTTFISLLAWLMQCVALFILLQALSVPLNIFHSIFIFATGTLAGALSMLPGGLGVVEGSITGLFMHFGLEKSMAVSLALLIRLVTLWVGILIGFFTLVKNRKLYIG